MSWQLLKFEFQSKNVLSFIHLLSHSLPFILLLAQSNKLTHTHTYDPIPSYLTSLHSEIPCKRTSVPRIIFWSGGCQYYILYINASERPRNCINLDFIQLWHVLFGSIVGSVQLDFMIKGAPHSLALPLPSLYSSLCFVLKTWRRVAFYELIKFD